MVKAKTKKLWGRILIGLGLGIVTVTHIAILSMGLPQELLDGHAMVNLLAVFSIVSGLWVRGKF